VKPPERSGQITTDFTPLRQGRPPARWGTSPHQRTITGPIAAHLRRRVTAEVVAIRHGSRRYAQRECWALWESAASLLCDIEPDPLTPAIPELRRAAELLGVRLPDTSSPLSRAGIACALDDDREAA
jgi:hypothetical protein